MPEQAVKEKPILFKDDMVRAILAGRKTQTRRPVKPQPFESEDTPGEWLRSSGRNKWQTNHRTFERYDKRTDEILETGEYHVPVAEWLMEGCPYEVGMHLWVRETWAVIDTHPGLTVWYPADDEQWHHWDMGRDEMAKYAYERFDSKKRPSIHMPRWACRLTLEVTDVRMERVQDTSEEDAKAEGLLSAEGGGGGPGAGYKWRGTGYQGAIPGYFHTPDRDGRCYCYLHGPTPAQCAFRELWNSINGKTYPWESNPWVWAISFKQLEESNV